jgi:glycosyltransferase involved in cell wall biosynthesis
VRNGETGLVVDPEDVVSLAAAMERMTRDIEAAREWGRRAQACVREEHSASRHYERLRTVYATAIAELQ